MYNKYVLSWFNENTRKSDFIDCVSPQEVADYGKDAIASLVEDMGLQHSEETALINAYASELITALQMLEDSAQFQMRHYLFTIDAIAAKPKEVAA